MKTTITALTLAISIASASLAATASNESTEANVIARLAVNLSENGKTYREPTYGIVKVLDNKSIAVDKWSYVAEPGVKVPVFKGTTTINISTKLAESLWGKIATLSDAKVKVTHANVVCKMLPPIGPNPALFIASGYDYESKKFAGELREVESNTGCWDPSKTSLQNDWEANIAASLEGALEALALQFAE